MSRMNPPRQLPPPSATNSGGSGWGGSYQSGYGSGMSHPIPLRQTPVNSGASKVMKDIALLPEEQRKFWVREYVSLFQDVSSFRPEQTLGQTAHTHNDRASFRAQDVGLSDERSKYVGTASSSTGNVATTVKSEFGREGMSRNQRRRESRKRRLGDVREWKEAGEAQQPELEQLKSKLADLQRQMAVLSRSFGSEAGNTSGLTTSAGHSLKVEDGDQEIARPYVEQKQEHEMDLEATKEEDFADFPVKIKRESDRDA